MAGVCQCACACARVCVKGSGVWGYMARTVTTVVVVDKSMCRQASLRLTLPRKTGVPVEQH